MTSSLPPEVLALVEMSPVEDLLLALLPPKFPGIEVKSLIADDQTFPLLLIRRDGDWGSWGGDARFLDAGQISVQTLTSGLNADEDSALLMEAARVVLRDSVNEVVPNRGYITKVRMVAAPKRVSDWATATGPVQFADLPTGVVRYQATFHVEVRRPLTKPFPLIP